MRIELTEDQRLVQRSVRDFAAAELRPPASKWDREGKLPLEIIPKLASLGLLGLVVPP
ncbi:MAG: acyl-CoA dehydrogenase family protein [Armatimonadetes bacterium]|nr:acyl-CoA dehydrogenase family protein [Armatimonadota bacterium]